MIFTKPLTEDEQKEVNFKFLKAAAEGNIDLLKKARDEGAQVNNMDSAENQTALHLAAYNGHEKCLEFLIIECHAAIDLMSKRKGESMTALHYAADAAEWGRENCIRLLAKHGADVNAKAQLISCSSSTALHIAIGHESCVRVLLELGADSNAIGRDGYDEPTDPSLTPLEKAKSLLSQETSPDFKAKLEASIRVLERWPLQVEQAKKEGRAAKTSDPLPGD